MFNMLKLVRTSLIIVMFAVYFQGCNQNTIVIPKDKASTNEVYFTINDAILSLANQLSKNNTLSQKDTGTITVTSFVDLQQLNKTSQFGRVIGESLFSELFVRGFNVSDFRGQNAITINANGEFYITRNITMLQSEVSNTYILVGTYSKIDQNVIINARILDNKTGKIVSSGRVMYANDDCSIFNVCNNAQRKIKLISDDIPDTINNSNQPKEGTIAMRKIQF
jgi:TolB-like protein